ncbi:MAG: BamA/TamA family outer membrane protein [Candidatus Palauibacterales bacterium]|nr:BamA/TamA family outer membrane protein [Candidatus Palauibacterales bacterium]
MLSKTCASLTACALLACVGLGAPPPAYSQQHGPPTANRASSAHKDTLPQDTYADDGARLMIERAREARGTEAAGLASYEATIRERVYVGLSASAFRRERALFLSEQVARVRWDSAGVETYRWLGSRQDVPIVGEMANDEDRNVERGDYGEDPDDLIPLDPSADRLMMGGEGFLHPLADTAGYHYRFASGDTIRIVLANSDREITLVQIRIEPRRSEFGLLAGAIWFDLETAALVRGAYRPARDFDMELDEPEDAEDVPGFIKPITARIDHMIVDYALQELRWWLPWRIRFEGEGRAGALLRVPVAIEISVGDYALNETDTLDVAEADLPQGWERRTSERELDDGRKVTEIVILPPRDSLRNSTLLSEDFFSGQPVSFSQDEIDRMEKELDELTAGRAIAPPSLSRYGIFRYNRVEALSAGIRRQGPVAGLTGWGEVRLGVGDLIPNVELGLREDLAGGAIEASAYYRLAAANDWGNPLNLESSVNALLFGYDYGEYYRRAGVSVELNRESGRFRHEIEAFAESHWSEEKHTNFSIPNLLGRADPPPNIRADEITIAGLAGRLRLQGGVDPDRLVTTGSIWGEAGVGDTEYARLAVGATVTLPLSWRLGLSLDGSGGTTFGDVPVQRLYYLSGPQTVRSFEPGQIAGEAFWLARAELAAGHPAVRFVAFGDVGSAGDRSDLAKAGRFVALGAGVSVLDGLIRADLARGVHGVGPLRWQFMLYLDALM